MLDIIIFSKDRAAQLDLCLQSIYKNLCLSRDECFIHIVYTASTPEFQNGYNLIKSWWRQTPKDRAQPLWFGEKFCGGFQEAYNTAISSSGEYIMFMTDDDIVYRQTPKSDIWPEVKDTMEKMNLFTVSFRLGTNTFVQDPYRNTRCFVPDAVIQSEELIRTWDWRKQELNNSFAYPFSLDGHIFRKHEIEIISSRISERDAQDYYNPNSLEGKGQHYLEKLPNHMGCFENSYVINTPINRVQETCTNKAGEYFKHPAKILNQRLLDGDRLTLEGMDFSTVIGCHQEIKLCWKEETNAS